MPPLNCNLMTDEHGRELLEHGTAAFPVACYDDDLTQEAVPWHWHEDLEVAIITEGTGLVTAGSQKYTIGPGDGFFINAGVLHSCWDLDHCRLHSLVFHPRLVGGSLDSVFYQNYVLPLTKNQAAEGLFLQQAIPWQKDILNAIVSAWQTCAAEAPGFEFHVRAALSEAVFLLCRNLPTDTQPQDGKTLRSSERIKEMLQFIHDNFSEELSVAQIARSAAVSESECLRCFRAAIGTTPIRYVKQYRIQRAAQLLTATRERICDIAARCGFQDMSYFTKTFREQKGCTPKEYRIRHTESDLRRNPHDRS